MAVLSPLIGYLLPGCFYSTAKKNDQHRSSLLIGSLLTRANLDLQLGHSSPTGWTSPGIAADGALNSDPEW